jgi:hypothetical protein
MPSSTLKKPDIKVRLAEALDDPANAEKGHLELARELGCKESMVRRARVARAGGDERPKWKVKEVREVELAKLRLDLGTQMRERMSQETVDHYAELKREGRDFPNLDVFRDGKTLILADGIHRAHAYKQLGLERATANIYEGTIRDAMLFACGANAEHALQRTTETKRRVMGTLLSDPEWMKWSVNKLRLAAGVSFEFADKFKKDWDARHGGGADDGVRTVERNGVTYEMDTKAIGKGKRTGLVEERDPGEDDADDLPKPANDQANSAVEEKTFLDSLPLYKALKGSAHTVFVEDALLFYRTEEGRTQLENFYRRHIRKTHAAEQGRYRLALESFLKTKHPRFWVRCLQCEGTGAISNKCCQSCGGRGYSVPGLPAVSV